MEQYDYVIIGSGFGGSVSALRLSEKGYKVLVVEKGKWYKGEDFAKTNWQLSKWLWLPALRWFGIMKITFFRHVGFISGTGVGGGSLVYANTLPVPKKAFFKSGSWKELADWQSELAPFYKRAKKMLGANTNPKLFEADLAMKELAQELGCEEDFGPTDVAVFFGEAGKTVPDPYFEGEGPERTGCIHCGACMTGCRHNAKNTLDKNYLYLAQKYGAEILAEQEVIDVQTVGADNGSDGYEITIQPSTKFFKKKAKIRTKGVVFSGGVLGTIKLLLKLKETSLPRLSERVGEDIRTNNESLIGITQLNGKRNLSEGIAIGSILQTDDHSHLEVVRYGEGSGFWRLAFLPFVTGKNFPIRFLKMIREVVSHPVTYLRYLFVRDWAKSTSVLLFMQTLDSTVKLARTRWGWMKTQLNGGEKPTAFIPAAVELSKKYEQVLSGKAMAFGITPLAGIPGTAHILGGAVMGKTPEEGVIDNQNRVFGYENMLVCDGSMISANPGVNPSLSITAISERAMSLVVSKVNSEQ